MLNKIAAWIRTLFNHKPVCLAIVRRYCDANGNYVGELYLEGTMAGVSAYRMIGVSLDSLPLGADRLGLSLLDRGCLLDTSHDFLAEMTPLTLRVGALDPRDNDRVCEMVRKLPRRNMTLVIQNRFIERVLEDKKI